ncbi:MAG: ferrochelatase [Bacteroidetes bacterium]|nr:ferrochelatase [Bacteroidota bacterium]
MKHAALLINLGSPESTDTKDVKKYLGEFLMDDHVIDLPYFGRMLLVKGIILNTRPKKSAAAYKNIWWEEGSPLIVLSKRLRKKVQEVSDFPVYLAMRYAQPSISDTLKKIKAENNDLEKIFVIPLYPHFAMSSYETVIDRVNEVMKSEHPDIRIEFQEPYYNDEEYIEVLAASIRRELPEDHHLLFSYHGIPVRHLRKSDETQSHCWQVENCCAIDSPAHQTCYRHQTIETTRLVNEKLGMDRKNSSQSFQSRLGRDEWLTPYTSEVFKLYPEQGIKKLAVVCPAFVSDCLETMEEINIEGRKEFLESGGESFVNIPCLNDDEDWAKLLGSWINKRLKA